MGPKVWALNPGILIYLLYTLDVPSRVPRMPRKRAAIAAAAAAAAAAAGGVEVGSGLRSRRVAGDVSLTSEQPNSSLPSQQASQMLLMTPSHFSRYNDRLFCGRGTVFTLPSYSTDTSCRCGSRRAISPALQRPAYHNKAHTGT